MKSIISILMLFVMAFSVEAKQIETTKRNPSPQGTYEDKTETHYKSADLHYLYCENPGAKACLWETSPWNLVKYNNVEIAVKDNIAMGTLVGNDIIEGAQVSWNAVSSEDYTFVINVTEVEE